MGCGSQPPRGVTRHAVQRLHEQYLKKYGASRSDAQRIVRALVQAYRKGAANGMAVPVTASTIRQTQAGRKIPEASLRKWGITDNSGLIALFSGGNILTIEHEMDS